MSSFRINICNIVIYEYMEMGIMGGIYVRV